MVVLKSLIEDGQLALPDGRRRELLHYAFAVEKLDGSKGKTNMKPIRKWRGPTYFKTTRDPDRGMVRVPVHRAVGIFALRT